jgi:hypothetical protein
MTALVLAGAGTLGRLIADRAWHAFCRGCWLVLAIVGGGVKIAKWIYLWLALSMCLIAYGAGNLRGRAADGVLAVLVWFALRTLDQVVRPWIVRHVMPQYVPRA